jgi:ABC-type uncharacterized transport system substrate-binding protein
MMRRREFLTSVAVVATLPAVAGLAQQSKIPTIGILVTGTPGATMALRFFPEALRQLGYIDGKNIRIVVRSAEGQLQRLPALAAELVQLKVDVIAPLTTPAVLAAKGATRTIPIVILAAGDPVANGIVASLAHPGGNITGVSAYTPENAEKLVELLKEMLPNLSRIGALLNAADPFSAQMLQHIRKSANHQRIEIVPFLVKAGPELDAALPRMIDKGVQAVIVQPTLPTKRAADLVRRYRLPAAAPASAFTAQGGLLAYVFDPKEMYGRAAVLVDKVLKGAKAADLPVERPTRFQLIINLRTAKAIGLNVPRSLLARADEVIE